MDPLLAAAAKGANRHSHLLSPYIFSLPADILSALQLRKIGAATPAAASSPAQTSDAEEGSSATTSVSSFSDSDASMSSTSEPAPPRPREQSPKRVFESGENAAEDDYELSVPRSSLLWFTAGSQATQHGVYRAAMPESGVKRPAVEVDPVSELRELQIDSMKSRPRQWALFMFGGGHFAGAVFDLHPRFSSRGKGKPKARDAVVLERKTFHRYTTRRKQGGAQSTKDASGGKAKSAGATLRRYNEAALNEEVRNQLQEWQDLLADCELIFLRASKPNQKTFFHFEGSPLKRGDPRIRSFPFATTRPVHSELVRAFYELTAVKTSHLTEAALAELDNKARAAAQPKAPPKPTQPKEAPAAVARLTEEEEVERNRWIRLVDMTRKGRLEALTTFVANYETTLGLAQTEGWGRLPAWMEDARSTPTLLHVASLADQAQVVKWLLEEKRASPLMAASPSSEMTVGVRPPSAPYDLAPSRTTRNVFRQLAGRYPDWWDWLGTGSNGAHVPSVLDEKKEEERTQKAKSRRDDLRQKLREREKERAAAQVAEPQVSSPASQADDDADRARTHGPQRLGGGNSGIKSQLGEGLSEAARLRLEREQRARAAERRLGSLQ